MGIEALSRRIALLAAHGAFILFIANLTFAGAPNGIAIALGAKQYFAWTILWLFLGAVFAYISITPQRRVGVVMELISAVMLALPVIYNAFTLTDIWI